MDFLEQLSPFSFNVFLMFLVILLKFIFHLGSPKDLWSPYRLYCQLLANKVNKPSNGPQQQKIAGTMALLVTITPLFVILWLFADLVEVTSIWQGLLLFFALDGVEQVRRTHLLSEQLTAKQNELAKQTVQKSVLREASQLSSMGLVKAQIEAHLTRVIQQLICSCVIFLLFGGLAALTYRLILEAHYSWNTKLTQYTYFGATTKYLVRIITWPAQQCFVLCYGFISVVQKSPNYVLRSTESFYSLGLSYALTLLAYKNNIKLGGVAMYGGNKVRRAIINEQGQEPTIKHLGVIRSQINLTLAMLALIAMFFAVMVHFSMK